MIEKKIPHPFTFHPFAEYFLETIILPVHWQSINPSQSHFLCFLLPSLLFSCFFFRFKFKSFFPPNRRNWEKDSKTWTLCKFPHSRKLDHNVCYCWKYLDYLIAFFHFFSLSYISRFNYTAVSPVTYFHFVVSRFYLSFCIFIRQFTKHMNWYFTLVVFFCLFLQYLLNFARYLTS